MAPVQKMVLEFKGLVTAPGNLVAPSGSLTTAQNCDFPAPGLAEKRHGFGATAYGFGGACWSVATSKMLGANLLFHIGTGSTAQSLQYGTGDAVRTALTTPDATLLLNTPDRRMKSAVSLRNHYLTSSRSPARLESDFSLHFAGMPRSPGISATQQGVAQLVAGTTQWLQVGYAVAYRIVWGRRDADGVEMVSAPSGRWIIANVASTNGYTGAALDTSLTIRVPRMADTTATAITTSWFYRVYRSTSVNTASAQPDDEMQLCYEANVTAAQIAAGELTITDSCPPATLGAYLYTNSISGGDVSTGLVRSTATSLGILASNDRPPCARDVASYASCLWWANFTTLQRVQFSILATGAAGNVLKAGDVIDVNGTLLTATAAAVPAAGQFRVETALGSVTLNIRQTAMNLVAAINSNSTTEVAAYIGSDASPGTIGSILIEAKRTDAVSFGVAVSVGSTLPYVPNMANGLNSTQESWGNGLAISKPFMGDAVAPANYLRVGRNDTVIQRVMSLRDALFIFTDDGIWWARGTQPADFVVEQFDSTFRLLARDALVACGDALYAWGAEGIARITSGGVEYIDLPIRNFVEQAQRGVVATVANFEQRAFAVAYRTRRRVVFWFPNGTEKGAWECSRALVYHITTGVWSTYRLDSPVDTAYQGKLSGVVRWSDELMHLGEWTNGIDSQLYRERNAGDYTDYIDSGSLASGVSTVDIEMQMTWNSAVPDPAGLCHWTELQIFNQPGGDVLANDSVLSANITSSYGLSLSATMTTAKLDTVPTLQRMMLSQNVGLATQQVVTVSHSTQDKRAFTGFSLLYHHVSHMDSR